MNIRRALSGILPLFLLSLTLLVYGCSDEWSDHHEIHTTIEGVAATGAPIVGTTYIRTAGGIEISGPTGADGSFSINVGTAMPPYLLMAEGTADGQPAREYSISNGDTTANINPLTSIIVASSTGSDDPASAFDDPNSVEVTDDLIDTAVNDLLDMLSALYSAYNVDADTDPLSGDFTADGTGLDAILDDYDFNIDSGAVSVVDVETGTEVASAYLSNLDNPIDTITESEIASAGLVAPATVTATAQSDTSILVGWRSVTVASGYKIYRDSVLLTTSTSTSYIDTGLTESTQYCYTVTAFDDEGYESELSSAACATTSAASGSELAEIEAMLEEWMAALNIGTTEALEPYYATNYGVIDGQTRTVAILDDSGLVERVGALMTSIDGVEIFGTDDAGSYVIGGSLNFANGRSFDLVYGDLLVTDSEGGWKLVGNGYYSGFGVSAHTHKFVYADDSIILESGLRVMIDDEGLYGLDHAVVTGPGLPVGGITLSKQDPSNDYLHTDPAFQTSSVRHWMQVLDDSTIASLADDSEYTALIYDASDNLVETRTWTLPKRPWMLSELTNGHYLTWDVTTHDLADLNLGSTLTINYFAPTAYVISHSMDLELEFWDSGYVNSGEYEANMPLDETSVSITTSVGGWTPTGGALMVEMEDEFERSIDLTWYFE